MGLDFHLACCTFGKSRCFKCLRHCALGLRLALCLSTERYLDNLVFAKTSSSDLQVGQGFG